MKAIDLYSGIGGWALGLKIAGIDVVASYERWENAANTKERNLGIPVQRVDIRKMDFDLLPSDVDIVVGSPPCNEFSFSNRGGSGDVVKGLKDIARFFEVVEFIRPRYWAMENVPRVASLLDEELTSDGALSDFVNLRESMHVEVIDMSRFGLPQRRNRCVAGNFDFILLDGYAELCTEITLGDVVSCLEKRRPKDVNFRQIVKRSLITDHEKEPFLDEEETRINKAAKEQHPVYNGMRFPDPMDKPARTVTATCTRVSRESVIVEDATDPDHYRRLTVRERAVLQGFPLTYQFFGSSYSEKLKMIGNAIPPTFTYFVALAMLGTPPNKVKPLPEVGYEHPFPQETPIRTALDQAGWSYPPNRRFWFAIPNLRFKSGTRFDLSNSIDQDGGSWYVSFYFGPSKDVRTIVLDERLLQRIQELEWFEEFKQTASKALELVESGLDNVDIATMQRRWTNKTSGSSHPFKLLDTLGKAAREAIDMFPADRNGHAEDFVVQEARESYADKEPVGEKKLRKYAVPILIGFLVGARFNACISENCRH